MDPQRWQQIKFILDGALAKSAESRSAFVASACGGDAALLADVEALLATDTVSSDALDGDAFSIFSEIDRQDTFIGRTIGSFTIREKIADGGMGSVYFAERTDGEFSQKAAVKLIRAGIHSDAIRRRFLNERQILASLNHPNIAKIIDGGTTDEGFPYLVMEYVEGSSLTEYVRKNNLGVNERLDLFREICEAVAFAHRNLVIHRDLKPANILVSDERKLKLLDFGIAKMLDSEMDGNTMTHQLAFTPDYASPEQLRGETLTTATDIYSLGVVLFELMTGSRPFGFHGKNFGEIIKAATTIEPPKPSSVTGVNVDKGSDQGSQPELRRLLKGDLDNIILKALSKDTRRRYLTVEQLSDDLQRYLKGQPVAARRDTLTYRFKKFTQRNPVLLASLAAGFLILIAGIVATLYQARQANLERERAERRFNYVRELANSFIFEVNERIDESPIRARELLVNRSVEYLDKLAAEASNDESLQLELAAAYERIAGVQAEHYGSGTGDTSGALRNHQKALEIRRDLANRSPENVTYALAVSASRQDIADITGTQGDVRTGLALYREDLNGLSQLAERNPASVEVQRTLARSHAKVGQGILRTGSFNESLGHYQQAIAITRNLLQQNPEDPEARSRLSVYLQYAAFVLLEVGRQEEGRIFAAEADSMIQSDLARIPDNLDKLRNAITSETLVGIAHRRTGDHLGSITRLERSLSRQQYVSSLDPSNQGDQNSLADGHLELGMAMHDAGNLSAAREHLDHAIAIYTKVAEADHSNISVKGQLAYTGHNLGQTLLKAGDKTKAIVTFRRALADAEAAIASDPNNTQFQHDRAICLLQLYGLRAAGKDAIDQALAALERLHAASPEHKKLGADLERARQLAAKL